MNTEGRGSGYGDEIGFFLISPTPTLGEGTFTFTGDFYGSVNTMYAGRAYLGADFSAGTSTAIYTLESGLLTVSRARVGDDYILDFKGTVEDGSTVTAHFRGPLEGAIIEASTEDPIPSIR